MKHPIEQELLVRYWANDLPGEEAQELEAHVFSCAACFEASSRVAAVARGLAEVIPPIALERDVARAGMRGIRQATGDFFPGVPKAAWLGPDTDLLVHRLVADLEDVEQVTVDITAPDGTRLLSFGDVPFQASAGAVIVACQRHFVERFPPDVNVRLRRRHRGGGESVDTYTVQHRIG